MWLKIIAGVIAIATPIVVWLLSPNQKKRRRRKRDRRALEKFSDAAKSGDADSLRDSIMRHR